MSSPMSRSASVTGLPPGVHAARLGKRLLAQLIDVLPPAVILLVIVPGETSGTAVLVAALLIAAWVGVVLLMFRNRAAGPGMRLMRLQLVGLRNGRPLPWGALVVRELILAVLTATVIGLVVMLVLLRGHPRKQGWHDLVSESVVIKERALAAPQQRQTAAEPAPAVTADGESGAPVSSTTPGADRAGTPGPAPGPASVDSGSRLVAASDGQRPSTAPPTQPRALHSGWFAVLDDGRDVEVTGLVLLGRNPQARPGEDDAELVKVADETRTVSKTHLALSVDASGLYVVDRGSTNGTILTRGRGDSSTCQAGEVLPAADGSIVSFGDHWLRIEHRADA